MCSLADKLKYLREKKGITKKEVAEAVGVHPSSIGNIEKGSIPQSDLLYNLSKFFNVSMEYLMDSSTEIVSGQWHLTSSELTLINLFIQLDISDQNDIIRVINLKLLKYRHGMFPTNTLSSLSHQTPLSCNETNTNLDMIAIGARIKNIRQKLNLSQIDIYKKCDISSGALSKIENGKTIPSILAFFKLSQALSCDINWLLTGNSSHMQNFNFCKEEEEYLSIFRQLSEDDQDEIIEIINLKLNKNKCKSTTPQPELSSPSNNNSDLKMT